MIDQKATNAKVVSMDLLYANDYNPNRMPETEMDLLQQCISQYGFLFPILVRKDKDEKYMIIDGYHRYEALKRMGAEEVSVVEIDMPYHDVVQLTVLMNRIKGLHQVEKMSDLVIKLENLGLTDTEICANLGMEPEEYLRLKQQLGIAHAFKHHEYSQSWEERL